VNSKVSYVFKNEDHELEVKSRITFSEEEDLINSVVQALFDENGVYHPSREDYYFWSLILGKYTNFDFDKYSANEILAIIDDSNIKDRLFDIISGSQFRRMQCSITEIVNARLNEHPLKGFLIILRDIFADGSGAIQKLLSDESFRSTLTEYINNNDKAALVNALNDAAYRDA
jgi:hypothetical protein